MNTWIIVLLATEGIGGIVVGWLINDARWKYRMYQQGWKISKFTKKRLAKMSQGIQDHLDSITDTELEEFIQKYTDDQVPSTHNDIQTDHSNKGYQEWIEEHEAERVAESLKYDEEKFLDDVYSPTWKRPPEVSTDHRVQLEKEGLS